MALRILRECVERSAAQLNLDSIEQKRSSSLSFAKLPREHFKLKI